MRDQVQSVVGIRRREIDGRRGDLISEGEDRQGRFDCAGSAQQMARHRLRRADGNAARMPAEHVFDGCGFGAIAERC
jgi:hypothetical protein